MQNARILMDVGRTCHNEDIRVEVQADIHSLPRFDSSNCSFMNLQLFINLYLHLSRTRDIGPNERIIVGERKSVINYILYQNLNLCYIYYIDSCSCAISVYE